MNDPTTGPRSNHDHDCRGAHGVDVTCRTAAQLRRTYISVREMEGSRSSSSLPRLSTINQAPEAQEGVARSAPREIPTARTRSAMTDGARTGAGAVSDGDNDAKRKPRGCGMWFCLPCFSANYRKSGEPLQPGLHPRLPMPQHLPHSPPQARDGLEFLVPDEPPLPNPALDPAQNPSAEIARQIMTKHGEIEDIPLVPLADAAARNTNDRELPEIREDEDEDWEVVVDETPDAPASGNEQTECTLQFSRRPYPYPVQPGVSQITTGLQALALLQSGASSEPIPIPHKVRIARPIVANQSPTYSQPSTSPRQSEAEIYSRGVYQLFQSQRGRWW